MIHTWDGKREQKCHHRDLKEGGLQPGLAVEAAVATGAWSPNSNLTDALAALGGPLRGAPSAFLFPCL